MIIDPGIVDRLETFGAAPWEGVAFRHVFEGRDPLAPTTREGRWAPDGAFAVLYTSLVREAAIAEGDHLIGRYSIPPSRPRLLCTIEVTLSWVVELDVDRLVALGIDMTSYARDWQRCPEIGAAANFLGFQGIIAPGARHPGANLMILHDQLDPGCRLEVAGRETLSPGKGGKP